MMATISKRSLAQSFRIVFIDCLSCSREKIFAANEIIDIFAKFIAIKFTYIKFAYEIL